MKRLDEVTEFIGNSQQALTNDEICKILVDELNKLEEDLRHDLFFWGTSIEQTPIVYYESAKFKIYGVKTEFGFIYFYPNNNYIYKMNIDINIKGDSQKNYREI